MEKVYILEGLDCPNCALKIEKALIKNRNIIYASVNAATLLCNIEYNEFNEEIEKEVIHLIESLEDITVIKKEKKHHHHEECGCGHHHEHKHEECGCGHHHEHKHEECGCGHDHEHKHEECGCGHHHDHEHHHEHKEEPKDKSLRKIKWTIEGLDCAHCALKVEDAVNHVEGVNYASLNFTTKTLLFYLDKHVDETIIINNVRKAILDKEDVQIIEENKVNEVKKDNIKYLIIVGILLLVLGLFLNNNIILIISYLFVGYKVIVKALKNIAEDLRFARDGQSLSGATIGADVGVTMYLKRGIASVIDVDVLAGAFHQDKVAVPITFKVVEDDCFAEGVYALLVDERMIKLHPSYMAIRENMNGEGDFINQFSHTDFTAFYSKNTYCHIFTDDE